MVTSCRRGRGCWLSWSDRARTKSAHGTSPWFLAHVQCSMMRDRLRVEVAEQAPQLIAADSLPIDEHGQKSVPMSRSSADSFCLEALVFQRDRLACFQAVDNQFVPFDRLGFGGISVRVVVASDEDHRFEDQRLVVGFSGVNSRQGAPCPTGR